jgi:hypothetical protein
MPTHLLVVFQEHGELADMTLPVPGEALLLDLSAPPSCDGVDMLGCQATILRDEGDE